LSGFFCGPEKIIFDFLQKQELFLELLIDVLMLLNLKLEFFGLIPETFITLPVKLVNQIHLFKGHDVPHLVHTQLESVVALLIFGQFLHEFIDH
jgi:hypothetical protein